MTHKHNEDEEINNEELNNLLDKLKETNSTSEQFKLICQWLDSLPDDEEDED